MHPFGGLPPLCTFREPKQYESNRCAIVDQVQTNAWHSYANNKYNGHRTDSIAPHKSSRDG